MAAGTETLQALKSATPLMTADMDDMEIDPAIAAAMGFSGFGGKKRKQGGMDEAFVDPGTSKHSKAVPGKGANNVPLGDRRATEDTSSVRNSDDIIAHAEAPEPSDGMQRQANGSSVGTSIDPTSLQALRQGVKNERGDMVYFLPSFIEDPWKNLQPS